MQGKVTERRELKEKKTNDVQSLSADLCTCQRKAARLRKEPKERTNPWRSHRARSLHVPMGQSVKKKSPGSQGTGRIFTSVWPREWDHPSPRLKAVCKKRDTNK